MERRRTQETSFEQAQRVLTESLNGKTFVLWNKFGSAGRNSYGGRSPIRRMSPDIAFSDYHSWSDNQPGLTLSKEVTGPYAEHHLMEVLRDLGQPVVISPWKPSPRQAEIVNRFGGQVLGIPPAVSSFFENKADFSMLLQDAGVPRAAQLDREIFSSQDALPSYSALRDRFGGKFVVQGNSSGGSGTVIVRGSESFGKMPQLTGAIRVSEYANDFYSTIYAFSKPNRYGSVDVYVDLPSHKTTDLPQFGISDVFGAGGDWSLRYNELSSQARSEVVDNVVRIGQEAYRQRNLKGHWNVEGFMRGENFGFFGFTELNARLGGGTEVSSVNQIVRGIPSFVTLHNILFLGGDLSFLPDADSFNNGTVQEMHQRRFPGPFYIKVKNAGEEPIGLPMNAHESGIYRLTESDTLEWIRPGLSTMEADFDMDEVLLANTPYPGTARANEREVCTVEGMAQRDHVFAGPHELSPKGERLMKAAFRYFRIPMK